MNKPIKRTIIERQIRWYVPIANLYMKLLIWTAAVLFLAESGNGLLAMLLLFSGMVQIMPEHWKYREMEFNKK